MYGQLTQRSCACFGHSPLKYPGSSLAMLPSAKSAAHSKKAGPTATLMRRSCRYACVSAYT